MRLNKCFTMPFNRLTCHQIVEGLVLCAKPRRGSTKQVNYIIIMKLTSKKGFSLIELLVALSILAVVAAVIVPRFLNVRQQAAQTATQAQLRTIERACQQFISLGGTLSSNAGSNLAFLSTTPPTTGSQQRTAANGCSDSPGNFGSGTVSIQLTKQGAYAANLTASASGFYWTDTGAAGYADGAANGWDITINQTTGKVTFISQTGSQVGANVVLN